MLLKLSSVPLIDIPIRRKYCSRRFNASVWTNTMIYLGENGNVQSVHRMYSKVNWTFLIMIVNLSTSHRRKILVATIDLKSLLGPHSKAHNPGILYNCNI